MKACDIKDWWKFKITDEQIKQIKAQNGEAIRKFWEDNERLIISLIKHELKRCYSQCMIDDAVSQVYVDLSNYAYRDSKNLMHSIFRSVRYCIFGYGFSYVSFDTILSDNRKLEDILIDKKDIEECFDNSVENEELYDMIARLLFTKSTKQQADFLSKI